jgi:hypothetical protein
MSLTRHPMRVAAGFGDSEGCLILDGGQLVAVLVRLSRFTTARLATGISRRRSVPWTDYLSFIRNHIAEL